MFLAYENIMVLFSSYKKVTYFVIFI